jgi:uroporphyrinogen decarboxylase
MILLRKEVNVMFNDRFLRACRGEKVDMTPIWFMRQAGRYQPEYREIRKKYSLVDITKNPEICVEVTTLPVKQLGVDAAILFSDIMVPVGAIGMPFELNPGPIIESPIRSLADVHKLHDIDVEGDLPYLLETIKILSRELPVPLIGFSGGAFTVASYMIEGGPSREHIKTKLMMYKEPEIWLALMDRLEKTTITYLEAQVNAGAHALQIFDSWVGSLSPSDYRQYVLPTMKRIFEGLKHLNVPKIYFGVGTGELLSIFSETGATVVGIDWRVPLTEASKRVGKNIAIQGNLDPAVPMAPWPEIERRAKNIIDQGIQHPGFIFNLGHGVTPEVPGENLKRITQFVHEYSHEQLSGK